MTKARLILAIFSNLIWEAALIAIWRWGLPQLGIQLPLFVLIIAMAGLAAYATISFRIGSQVLSLKETAGFTTVIGSKAKVMSPLTPEGLVKINSELWTAKSVEGNIDKGEEVTVVGQVGLKLLVRKGSSAELEGKE